GALRALARASLLPPSCCPRSLSVVENHREHSLYRLCWAVAAALVIGGIIADRYEHAHGLIILVFAAMAWLASVAARVGRYTRPSLRVERYGITAMKRSGKSKGQCGPFGSLPP